jgi:hypothetical protein
MAAAGNADPERALRLAGVVEALWESLGTDLHVGFRDRLLERYLARRASSWARTPTPRGPRAARWLSTTR